MQPSKIYKIFYVLLKLMLELLGMNIVNKILQGECIAKKRELKLYFNTRDYRFSSSGLRKEVLQKEKKKLKSILK